MNGLSNTLLTSRKKAQAFGLKVIAYDPFVAAGLDVELIDFDALLDLQTKAAQDVASVPNGKPLQYPVNKLSIQELRNERAN